MTRKHLFVMDPLEGIDPNHDTTYVFMREVEKRNGEVWYCQSVDLSIRSGNLTANGQRVTFPENESGESSYFRTDESSGRMSVSEFDLVWMREDPPFDSQYLYATYLLDQSPTPVINSPEGIRNSNEKLFILEFPDLIPPTWVGSNPDEAMEFLITQGEVVVKSLSGFGGEEVYRIDSSHPSAQSRLSDITDGGERTVLAQKFLPEVLENGDRRIILLGGEPIGGLTRHPSQGDFRANLHSGGEAGEVYVTDEEREICEIIKPKLLERGLHFVGLDVIGNQIMEINVTSPTCVQEINRNGNKELQTNVLDYVNRRLIGTS